MPTLLITRPKKASESLVTILENSGYLCQVDPLLIIEPTHTPLPSHKKIDGVMITSANTFDALTPFQKEMAPLLAAPCFAVGPKTATKAKEFGFQDVTFRDQDGAALARLIAQSLPIDSTILHIAASEVASGAYETLHEKGYEVVIWPVYRAVPSITFASKTVAMFRDNKIDAVILYSVRTAETFMTLVAKHGLQTEITKIVAIGLSKAIIEVVKPLSWRHLGTAEVPNEEAIFELVKKYCPPN